MGVPPHHSDAVVITGTSTGIGRSCALHLAAHGYQVFAGVRRESDGRSLVEAARGRLHPLPLDVTDESQIAEAVERVAEETGGRGIAALVNNAGVGVTGPLELVSLPEVRRGFEVDFFGQLAVTQAFLPQLRRARGRLITMGSITDRVFMPFSGALSAPKSSLAAVNDALRVELAPWGIRVVLIEPAQVLTPGVDRGLQDGLRSIDRFTDEGRRLYGDSYRRVMKRSMALMHKGGSDPQVVADTVLKALTATKPKPRYLCGAGARPLAAFARMAPTRVYDTLRLMLFTLPTAFGSRA